MSIHDTGASFDVICKRCDSQFNVVRNWGGGIHRPDRSVNTGLHNPAICDCGSRQLEAY